MDAEHFNKSFGVKKAFRDSLPLLTSKNCLAILKCPRKDLWCRFIIFDETWIHHSTPKSNEQPKQWMFRDESAPLSTNKAMTTVFWDVSLMIAVDYLETGEMINGEYNVN